jgi:hypothetical protein
MYASVRMTGIVPVPVFARTCFRAAPNFCNFPRLRVADVVKKLSAVKSIIYSLTISVLSNIFPQKNRIHVDFRRHNAEIDRRHNFEFDSMPK